MSGGSFGYLCYKSVEEILLDDESINNMGLWLIDHGYIDAGSETLQLLYVVRQTRIRIDVIHSRLRDVFKAVEWYESGDLSIESVENAIAEYRGDDYASKD